MFTHLLLPPPLFTHMPHTHAHRTHLVPLLLTVHEKCSKERRVGVFHQYLQDKEAHLTSIFSCSHPLHTYFPPFFPPSLPPSFPPSFLPPSFLPSSLLPSFPPSFPPSTGRLRCFTAATNETKLVTSGANQQTSTETV